MARSFDFGDVEFEPIRVTTNTGILSLATTAYSWNPPKSKLRSIVQMILGIFP